MRHSFRFSGTGGQGLITAGIILAEAAELRAYGRLIMNDEDVDCVHQTLPEAKLYLTHFDNVAHASITRSQMRGALVRRGVDNYVIPEDGETVIY